MIDPNLIDFKSIFTVVKSTGNMMGPEWRMLRATVIELAIEKYSGGQLKYVNAVGYDFIGIHDGLKYESKSLEGLFQKTTGYTNEIILKNFHGNTGVSKKTFDHILVWDSKNMIAGIADWNAANKHHKVKGANVTTKLEEADVTILSSGIVVGQVQPFLPKLTQLIRASI